MNSVSNKGLMRGLADLRSIRIFSVTFAAAAAVLVALLPVAAIAADDPASAQYNDQTPDSGVLSSSSGSDPASVGSLPFTGTDILILAVAAIVLFAAAATLRRFARRRESAN